MLSSKQHMVLHLNTQIKMS
uniref:Uncharacterized protein n=1 Tax=Brassica juncea TaxID=3707 RepID=Q9G466_BRAJU|nr:unknown [Brassica juncea]